ncbi:hypothetical protein M422DRAFT_253440 [Sphaerobolus stellatus SS14]|uniref:Uncharacterized protein n=1 Tax=Sphaerobolus stellatus (strain SS14) TaxID=990650 RepID=A0A0C9UJJ9_SPHS4|nr:hypothetical protein M422DRAFT_253440 [Sphaerobolus stellatus SS14]
MNNRPLAEVNFSKLKECPILTEGRIDPFILQNWTTACKCYMRHAEKKPSEIGGQTRIDTHSLSKCLGELAVLVLEKKWQHKMRQRILAAKQGAGEFIDRKIEALKDQLKASLNEELRENLMSEPPLSTKLEAWSIEVKERDDRMRTEDKRTKRLIEASNAA